MPASRPGSGPGTPRSPASHQRRGRAGRASPTVGTRGAPAQGLRTSLAGTSGRARARPDRRRLAGMDATPPGDARAGLAPAQAGALAVAALAVAGATAVGWRWAARP